MKKTIVSLFFTSAMCAFAFAQSQIPKLDSVKKLKPLESTREDVKKSSRNINMIPMIMRR